MLYYDVMDEMFLIYYSLPVDNELSTCQLVDCGISYLGLSDTREQSCVGRHRCTDHKDVGPGVVLLFCLSCICFGFEHVPCILWIFDVALRPLRC